MRVLLAGLLLIIASCGAPKQAPPTRPSAGLELRVELEGEFTVGKSVKLKALITNRSDRPVDAVICLDHSDVGWRYPIMRARWTGPDGKEFLSGVGGGCGNSDAFLDKHLVRLAPGQSFDPFEPSPYGNCTQAAYLRKEGRHAVTLTVDYSAADPGEWNGSMERKEIKLKEVESRLANVPRVKLEATREFVVKK